MRVLKSSLLLLLWLPSLMPLCTSCEAKTKKETKQDILPSPKFPTPPIEYKDPALRAGYIITNVFAPYETLDTDLFLTDAVAEQFFVDYVAIAVVASDESRDKSFQEAFSKGSDRFDKRFIDFADKYLYEVNSPLYNESMYFQILKAAEATAALSESQKIIFDDRYGMYLKNQVGSQATDFLYITKEGRTRRLYDLHAKQTLVVFYNPGCHVCRETMKYISDSPTFNSAMTKGLTILCISLSDDMVEWEKYLDEIPPHASVGVDKGQAITQKSLYDIKAFPTLYLLDENKIVVAKDPQVTEVEERLKE